MKAIRTRLTQLSICPCGDRVLNTDVGVGTEYVIYPDSIRGGWIYACGECGRIYHDVATVLVEDRFGRCEARRLPLALFELVVTA
jgi:hypothetical protein